MGLLAFSRSRKRVLHNSFESFGISWPLAIFYFLFALFGTAFLADFFAFALGADFALDLLFFALEPPLPSAFVFPLDFTLGLCLPGSAGFADFFPRSAFFLPLD